VETMYLRARDLVEQVGDSTQRFPTLWGLWFVDYNRGQYAAARMSGERLLDAARIGNESGQLVEAHHALWATLTGMGCATAALGHIESGIALYDRQRHASQAFLYGGHDPGVCCRYHLAMNLWLLGHYNRSMNAISDALRLAEELKHPGSAIIALWFAAWLYYHRGDRSATKATVERVLALTSEYGISRFSDIGILTHWVSGTPPDRQQLEELSRPQPGESNWRRVFYKCVLAQLYGAADYFEDGLAVLEAISSPDREAFYAPEIHRLEGELRAKIAPRDPDEVESCLRKALDLAGARGEKSLQLRAATSLAQLWRSQDRDAEALALLAPVYSSFGEGFDLPDLKQAKVLLDQLAANSELHSEL
jgi:predicted ATPase